MLGFLVLEKLSNLFKARRLIKRRKKLKGVVMKMNRFGLAMEIQKRRKGVSGWTGK